MVPHGPTPGNDPLPHSVALTSGRATAAAAPEVAAALRELLARDVADWSALGFVQEKQRTVRAVFSGELAGIRVHVKVFRAHTFADRVRDLVRRDRGAAEAAHLRRARELGLPAVDVLAHGFASEGEALRSFVVTRTVAGATFTFATPAAVHERAGALLRTLHDRGVLPGDLHPGNLVVDERGEPRLLDLTNVRHGGDVDLVARARALAFFCHELDGGARDPAARALMRGYLAAGELPEGFARELVLATRRWRADALPAFGRRALRPCRHTEVAPRRRGEPRWVWHLEGDAIDGPNARTNSEAERDQNPAANGARAACEAFAAAPPQPAKSGRRGAVWLLEELVAKDREAGAARKLWRAHYWLLFARVPAPAPVALRLFAGRGHVFARRLRGATLHDELARGALRSADLTAAARAIGDAVGRLHAHGLGNRDLKLENLVRDPDRGTVSMVDLDGVRRRAAIDTRGRGADLGRLLAAFRAAGAPGGPAIVRTFVRGYLRAHRTLQQSVPLRRVQRAAERRAGEWASAHR